MGADGERNVCHAPVSDPEECAYSAAAFLLLEVSPHALLSRLGCKETKEKKAQFSLRSSSGGGGEGGRVLGRNRHKLASQYIVLPHIGENVF